MPPQRTHLKIITRITLLLTELIGVFGRGAEEGEDVGPILRIFLVKKGLQPNLTNPTTFAVREKDE